MPRGGKRAGAGRRALPAEVKTIKGTLRTHRQNPATPKSDQLLGSDPPKHLTGVAADAWTFMAENSPRGLLQANNAPTLEKLAIAYGTWRTLTEEIVKRGLAWRKLGVSEASNAFPTGEQNSGLRTADGRKLFLLGGDTEVVAYGKK